MGDDWFNSPWLVQILGGGLGALLAGLVLSWTARRMRGATGESSPIVTIIQSAGYVLLTPFFVIAFLASIPLFAILYISESANECRYTPTCKEYLVEAIEIHGLIGGTLMGISRLNRCEPPHGGHDPVPPRRVG